MAWAEAQYLLVDEGASIRGSTWTIEQLEHHARTLALGHLEGTTVSKARWGGATEGTCPVNGHGLRRLEASGHIIARAQAIVSQAQAAGRPLTGAGEWLLDNHHVIHEQLALAIAMHPRGRSRLPRLAAGERRDRPRIYDIVFEFAAHVDGRVDDEALSRYLAAYQSVTPLTLAELWAVSLMLRLVLVEHLRQVAQGLSWRRVHADRGQAWAERISTSHGPRVAALAEGRAQEQAEGRAQERAEGRAQDQDEERAEDRVALAVAELVRAAPPLTAAFVTRFTQSLRARGATTAYVMAWLDQRLEAAGLSVEELVRAESQRQAADQASMAHGIASLRRVGSADWRTFVENHSVTEAILRTEPADIYRHMDLQTRQDYRQVVEGLALRLKCDEAEVARAAVGLATATHAESGADVHAHVGYFLVDEGQPLLLRRLAPRLRLRNLSREQRRAWTLTAYLAAIAVVSVAGALAVDRLHPQAHLGWRVLVGFVALLALSQTGVALVNWAVTARRKPRHLSRLDFKAGVPEAARTLVVVPTLLVPGTPVATLLDALKLRALANRGENLWFALLTDFSDADSEHHADDAALLAQAEAGIEVLNQGEPGQRFFLLHRPRVFNARQGCWMGRERKRGKIEDLNALICADESGGHASDPGVRFSRIVGDPLRLRTVRYVITLDTDTELPWSAARRLVEAAAHPLNRPVLDGERRRLLRGYAILQPRVAISLRSAARSRFARLTAGDVGLDPYTGLVSDLYQDLFGETSFIGKGIYDVRVFFALLHGRFPDNAVLSHDLLESCYAHTAHCGDVELLEDTPADYLADVTRRHRWMRGDWQIVPWLWRWVRDMGGARQSTGISALSRWKVVDNLRRIGATPAWWALFVAGWLTSPAPGRWTLVVLALMVLPELPPIVADLVHRPRRLPWGLHLVEVGRVVVRRLARLGLTLMLLPFEAAVALDATARSLWRMYISRRALLEWLTAAAVARAPRPTLGAHCLRMWVAPTSALLVAAIALVYTRDDGRALLAWEGLSLWALPVLALWTASPLVAWWLSRPSRPHAIDLDLEARRTLRDIARRTWRYFEVFVGPQENWLPPDNSQEPPTHRVAHRTSPTNLGLSLLANLSAYDLGYLTGGQLLERCHQSLASMETLERHRGHFLNWYDTLSRKPLQPLYVSTVDSGNLVAHLKVLRGGLLGLGMGPGPEAHHLQAGLRDTWRALSVALAESDAAVLAESIAAILDQATAAARAGSKAGAPPETGLVAAVGRTDADSDADSNADSDADSDADAHADSHADSHAGLDPEALAGPAPVAGATATPALLASVRRHIECPTAGLSGLVGWLANLLPEAAALHAACAATASAEARWWAGALERQVRAWLTEVDGLAPWARLPADADDATAAALRAELDAPMGGTALAEQATRAVAALEAAPAGGRPGARAALHAALLQGIGLAAERAAQAQHLGARCDALGDADFGFLYQPDTRLLAIGYLPTEGRLDASQYDLLASEARLASFVGIAAGQLPVEHWFALGRRLTRSAGRQVLLSWSGSMFEYLMPRLVMPEVEGTLLDQTARAALRHQIAYGRACDLPWGVSESCYHLSDSEGTYQYRAFGVPGLGLQPGLAEDQVVAPYATALALLVDATAAAANLRRLVDAGYLGRYGLYEAIDFTERRRIDGAPGIVRAFMAHHQGMSLVALSHALEGPLMWTRFLADAPLRAAATLLNERIPRPVAFSDPHPGPGPDQSRTAPAWSASTVRVIGNPNAAFPDVQLLSNGRYQVMVTASGGGYSQWNTLALTRWSADPTTDPLGTFLFVSDRHTGRSGSCAFQPLLQTGGGHEVVFSPGRATFRRQIDHIETLVRIVVSSEHDLEVRRIRLTNRDTQARALVLTSYTEVVLALGVTDGAHRAFSNLFVHAEPALALGATLFTRRPRAPHEQPAWMVCALVPSSGSASGSGTWVRGDGQPALPVPGHPHIAGVGPCSAETDRGRFIGRGRSLGSPAALDGSEALSNTFGESLDPCAALRRSVDLEAGTWVELDLIIGAAADRAGIEALLHTFQDHRLVDRIFEGAAAHGVALASRVGASPAQSQTWSAMAAALLYPLAACRAPSGVLRRNRRGPSGLWGHGISGDQPIVLVQVEDASQLRRVDELLSAHAWWRLCGLSTDLVIWVETGASYRGELTDRVRDVVARRTESRFIDVPGGVFVRLLDAFTPDDQRLLLSTARLIVEADELSLDAHLLRWQRASARPRAPMLVPGRSTPGARAPAPTEAKPEVLHFANGLGGFASDGREYVINPPPGRATPAPWVNVMANPRLGTLVSEAGSAFTWFTNAQLYRISPWSNDPVIDPSGETLFIRDDRTGTHFNPCRRAGGPAGLREPPVRCRHGFGYSIFERATAELATVVTAFVAVESPVKFVLLRLHNLSGQSLRLSVLATVDLVLDAQRTRPGMHVVTERDPFTGALLARNRAHHDLPGAVVFFECSEQVRSVSGDRSEVLGRNGNPDQPAALRLRQLSGRLGAGLDPCAAMLVPVALEAGETRDLVFMLGAGDDLDEVIAVLARHRGVPAAYAALHACHTHWDATLGAVQVHTPDPALDLLTNGWLIYQTISGRLWGRTGFYQSGGAYGFRDQLQDVMALLHTRPELARAQVLRSAARQFLEGDVQHWWHPPSGAGVRTTCSDDLIWLPWAVCTYVAATGDHAVLDEPVRYLTGRLLRPGEESNYEQPGPAEVEESLYDHCVRALARGHRLGAHGLPLMGGGDWNDGMSLVGHGGRGESVWLAFFLHAVLTDFSALAAHRGDEAVAHRSRHDAQRLAACLARHGWDGGWYRRAYFDDGTPLGTAAGRACQIDALPQSWATLAGVGTLERRTQALEAMWNALVDPAAGLMHLFTPPFGAAPPEPTPRPEAASPEQASPEQARPEQARPEQAHPEQASPDPATTVPSPTPGAELEPGYIKGYPPGVRENGGQYTHAAIWGAMALARAGQRERAATLVALLNPINHSLDLEAADRYRVEPYVMAADVYGHAPHTGRGGWTWYTGSAAWYYRHLVEALFGLERQGATLRLRPQAPRHWRHFEVRYRFGTSSYLIRFEQLAHPAGPPRLTVDGIDLTGDHLPLIDDGRDHTVRCRFSELAPA